MSKSLFAKQFDTNYEYESAKREQRKADRNKRDMRRQRNNVWQPRED